MSLKLLGLLSALSGLALAGPALAQVYVVTADSNAVRCSKAAATPGLHNQVIPACSDAIRYGGLTEHDLAGTLTNRGVLELRAGLTSQAAADFDQAVAISPGLEESWIDRGFGALAQQRWEEARDSADHALSTGGRHRAMAYYVRAEAEESLEDLNAAYRDYGMAARLNPDWQAPRLDLARFTVERR